MKFMIKETLERNIGLLVKSTFSIMLFMIGTKTITNHNDPTTTLFLTLIWCYVFLVHFRFIPKLIYRNDKGDRWEEY